MVERSPEKAGVGGSTPSLATTIPKKLVRISEIASVRMQSPSSRSTTKNGLKHLFLGCHPVRTDGVCVELQCRLYA